MNVAQEQRKWLEHLETVEPAGRPITAQSNKSDPWTSWQLYRPDVTLWTRSLLLNEVVFDADSDDKELNESIVARLAFAARTMGARPIVADSGGRGWHAHVWLDADTLQIETSQAFACDVLKVDVYKIAREVVFDAIVKRANLSPVEAKALDRTKIAWNKERMGGMIRDFGSVGKLGYAKTMQPGSLVFPSSAPSLMDVSALNGEFVKRLTRAITSAKRHADPTAYVVAVGSFNEHPCVAQALAGHAPVGERGVTMLHLARLARSCGLSERDARGVAAQYQTACGDSWDEDAVATVKRVFDERVEPRIACPNRLGLSVCSSGQPCPKAPFKLTK